MEHHGKHKGERQADEPHIAGVDEEHKPRVAARAQVPQQVDDHVATKQHDDGHQQEQPHYDFGAIRQAESPG